MTEKLVTDTEKQRALEIIEETVEMINLEDFNDSGVEGGHVPHGSRHLYRAGDRKGARAAKGYSSFDEPRVFAHLLMMSIKRQGAREKEVSPAAH